MKLRPLRYVAVLGSLQVNCGDSVATSDGFAVATDTGMTDPDIAASTTGSSGPTTTATTATTATADASDSDATPTEGVIKYDLGAPDAGTGDDPGPTCATLDDLPRSSLGCVFYAASLPNLGDPKLSYGIGVGNPGDTVATVTLEDRRGPNGTLRVITTFEVAPHAAEMLTITGPDGLLKDEVHSLENPGLQPAAALRITSDAPVTAMQINPVGGSAAHTTDASMLLPVNALDTAYIAVGYESYIPGLEPAPGDIVVIATEDATVVTTQEGDVMLDALDAWLYHQGNDPTGFFVSADRPVSVMSGTRLTYLPADPTGDAADHLEEQVIPLSAWGKHYVAARHPHRVPEQHPAPEQVWWRVIAGEENVAITVTPPQPDVGAKIELAAPGDFVEIKSTESFVVEGDRRFMLVQYMAGAMIALGGDYPLLDQLDAIYGPDEAPIGDPYMAQVIPTEQWLTALSFITDTQYPRDFVVLSREAGTEVSLDCLGVVSDDHFVAIEGTPYEVGSVDLDIGHMGGEGMCKDGQQYLTATAPVGVLVGGVDHSASYGYPGGMGLLQLWAPPQRPPG